MHRLCNISRWSAARFSRILSIVIINHRLFLRLKRSLFHPICEMIHLFRSRIALSCGTLLTYLLRQLNRWLYDHSTAHRVSVIDWKLHVRARTTVALVKLIYRRETTNFRNVNDPIETIYNAANFRLPILLSRKKEDAAGHCWTRDDSVVCSRVTASIKRSSVIMWTSWQVELCR